MAGIGALAIGYVLSQFYRSFLAVLAPTLTEDLGATRADLSTAFGVWFASFALMQFAVGVWLDRHGPRRTSSMLLALGGGGGAFLFATATTPAMVIVAMALIGAGCSPVLMAAMFIFAKSFAPSRFAMLASWLVGVGTLGNIVSASPLAAAAEIWGWRGVMAGLGAFTLLVAAAIVIFTRDPDRLEGGGDSNAGLGGYLQLLKVRHLWPILPLTAISYSAAAGIRGLWAGPYLADIYGADVILIGQVTLLMAIAMAVGSFIYGPVSTFLGTLKWLVVAGNGITLIAILWLSASPSAGLAAASFLLVAIGLCGMTFSLLIAHGTTFLPPHLTGRGVTLLNFFSIGGTGVMQFATGGIVAAAAGLGDSVAVYSLLFAFYAALLSIGLLVYLLSRDPAMQQVAQGEGRT
ncbi:MFS transporter [Chelativorans sp. Marseille-P2723]|uniref:MFS transporter n=1 Tax=Chelativorans sp. Marseille-P2723 TaxID=2709133 RepID=UPI00156F87C0|nr:MFS transporter [Chelativorans sp. Marseille-P2723]